MFQFVIDHGNAVAWGMGAFLIFAIVVLGIGLFVVVRELRRPAQWDWSNNSLAQKRKEKPRLSLKQKVLCGYYVDRAILIYLIAVPACMICDAIQELTGKTFDFGDDLLERGGEWEERAGELADTYR